jgi:hypothetical protein
LKYWKTQSKTSTKIINVYYEVKELKNSSLTLVEGRKKKKTKLISNNLFPINWSINEKVQASKYNIDGK